MNTEIKSLPGSARVWIYQAGKKLSETEQSEILAKTAEFVKNWSAHGTPLNAKTAVLFDTFLVLAVDENEFSASGCSIDKSLRFIQQLEAEFDISFLDRRSIALWEKETVRLMNLEEFKSQINEGEIRSDSIIFNNLVSSISQMETEWKIPVSKSWLKKYLPEN